MPMEVSHNEALWFFQLSKVQLSQEQDGARRIDRIATASSAAYRLADRVVRRAPPSVVFTPAIPRAHGGVLRRRSARVPASSGSRLSA